MGLRLAAAASRRRWPTSLVPSACATGGRAVPSHGSPGQPLKPVAPSSLYLAQLCVRPGGAAVHAVGYGTSRRDSGHAGRAPARDTSAASEVSWMRVLPLSIVAFLLAVPALAYADPPGKAAILDYYDDLPSTIRQSLGNSAQG